MLSSATISSRTSSTKSEKSSNRNSSMPSLHSFTQISNPFFHYPSSSTSFDATNFIFQEQKGKKSVRKTNAFLKRYNSYESQSNFDVTQVDDSVVEKRLSNTAESRQHEYDARDFLETFSLPRVARIGNAEPLLLYRCFDSFTKVLAKGVHLKKGKEIVDDAVLYFPEGYSGWFSLLNEKQEKTASKYASILELVREQVCSFISMQPFTAYSVQGTNSTDNQGRMQYFKTQVRGGQMFQLRAVFQHRDYSKEGRRHSTRSSRLSRSARDKDLQNRYAHLICQTNQEYYVPLTTKGEFYELHSSIKSRLCFPGLVHKTGPLALDKECLYKITHLLRRVALPIRVKLLAGPLPPGLPKDFTDTFILEKKFQEPLLVTCTLPPVTMDARHQISCISLNSELKISKCTLGFDSENRLFKSQRVQAALAFCQKNVERWYREVKIAPNIERDEPTQAVGLFREEPEDSMEHNTSIQSTSSNVDDENKQIITKKVIEKFPKSTKWYKQFNIFGKSDNSSPDSYEVQHLENSDKCRSIDRYKDMSKFIEEKLNRSYNPVKKSASFMFSTKLTNLEEVSKDKGQILLKCQSLDVELNSYDASENEEKELINKKGFSHMSTKVAESTENIQKMQKVRPDILPSQSTDNLAERSFITERLCSRFHVKTRISTKSKPAAISHVRSPRRTFSQDDKPKDYVNVKSVAVQVYEEKKTVKTSVSLDDIPYSHVIDEVTDPSSELLKKEENIYDEICEKTTTVCDKKPYECKRTSKSSEYNYVKLGSNGDSVTQSDSDEAIYSTLR